MTITQRGVIGLIRSALSGKPMALPDGFELEKAFEVAKKHRVVSLIYYGALVCGFDNSNPIMLQMLSITCRYLSISEQQTRVLSKIMTAFDENKIDYMPVKGLLLRNIYPKADMRVMGDGDILIRFEDYNEKIRPLMLSLGLDEGRVSDNELVWNESVVCVELHRRLIPSYNKDYYAYYGDGWRLAKKCDGTRYAMTDEDQMIYLFTHFAKHYRDSGIGLRHFVDLWVYRNANPQLDEKYIKTELKKLQLYDFYKNILKTLQNWFNDGESSEKTEFITNVIFLSGVYGTAEANALSEALKLSKTTGEKSNIHNEKLKNEIFPPYNYMCKRYPFLEKWKLLLPLFWIVRIIDAAIFRRENIKRKQERLKAVNNDAVNNYHNSLNYVGLDFNFEE
ncbi:MAG: nucleotidyltransferase family protein [Clostridia bacterium]|nr:nucleotidyltransferase family protein [Clostridia bacterium]